MVIFLLFDRCVTIGLVHLLSLHHLTNYLYPALSTKITKFSQSSTNSMVDQGRIVPRYGDTALKYLNLQFAFFKRRLAFTIHPSSCDPSSYRKPSKHRDRDEKAGLGDGSHLISHQLFRSCMRVSSCFLFQASLLLQLLCPMAWHEMMASQSCPTAHRTVYRFPHFEKMNFHR